MPSNLDRHLSDCRRRGLVVDEDFERGSASLRRGARGIALMFLLTVLAGTITALARPAFIDAAIGRALNGSLRRQPESGRVRQPYQHATLSSSNRA